MLLDDLEEKYQKVWEKVLPLLKKGLRKDFVRHTKFVVMGMQEILKKENGNKEDLILAAMLHDVGWANVSKDLQMTEDQSKKEEALRRHLIEAEPLILKILIDLDYPSSQIQHIVEIVKSHKFCEPKEKDKQLLIDADNLSDAYKEAFYADCRAYGKDIRDFWKFRMKSNRFYTKTAKTLFLKMMEERKKEIE